VSPQDIPVTEGFVSTSNSVFVKTGSVLSWHLCCDRWIFCTTLAHFPLCLA
jgi:hypothetical protein